MQVFTSVIVLGLCFIVFVISHINDYKQRKAENITGIAQVIASNSVSALQFEDSDAAAAILSDLKKVAPDVTNGVIFDKQNRLFAEFARSGTDSFSWDERPGANREALFTQKNLFVTQQIINEGDTLGSVFLKADLNELARIKAKQYQLAIVILIIGVGLAFLISYIVQSYISKRLLNLVKVMHNVSKTGDYSKRVNTEGDDEISVLSNVFNNLMDQVTESQRKKDEFIGIASHELKTPLTSIKGYLQLLDSIEDKQPNKQFIGKTLDGVNRLQQLIFDLLDVSKIQSGQLHLNTSSFDIGALIEEAITSFQVMCSTHKITWKGQKNTDIVSGDRQRIEQVLANLLSNAVKYSPSADEVFVYTEKTVKDFIIKVRDFGIGIPEGERERVFDRFYRAKDNSVLISGFGLGLYICKDIMKRHNGKIWIESDGKGTTFCFSLPIQNVEVPLAAQKQSTLQF